MLNLSAFIRSYIKRDEAATAIEYVLIASGIAVAIAATIFVLGDGVGGLFTKVSNAVKNPP